MALRNDDTTYNDHLRKRHARGTRMRAFFMASVLVAFLALIVLVFNIINQSFGLVAVSFEVQPETLSETPLDELDNQQLGGLIAEHAGGQTLRLFYEHAVNHDRHSELASINGELLKSVLNADIELPPGVADRIEVEASLSETQIAELGTLLDQAYGIDLPLDDAAELERLTGLTGRAALNGMMGIPRDWADTLSEPLLPEQGETFAGFIDVGTIQDAIESQIINGGADHLTPLEDWQEQLSSTQFLLVNDLTVAERADILALNLTQEDLLGIIDAEIIKTEINESWNLNDSVFERGAIEARVAEKYPQAELRWNSWLNKDIVTSRITNDAETTGVRTAFLGSVGLMLIVISVSFPLGVGAAIYLEEYASDNWFNRIIETNIRNLAGVPSIIYGMLGLAIFVRALGGFTGGRSILSGGLTLTLLILPIIIIQSQEALRAVPYSIREGSYGLGATRWQTIWRQVLPSALPGILTGTIIAISRAIGETAPLIVVGAATFISVDPDGPLSEFTALPIMIFQWTLRPEPEFQNAAGAAIILLLILLLSMNSFAIILRNRTSRRL